MRKFKRESRVCVLIFTIVVLLITTNALAQDKESKTPQLLTKLMRASDADTVSYDWGAFNRFMNGRSFANGSISISTGIILPGQWPHPPHQHAREEVIFIKSGNGTWYLKDKQIDAKSGDVLYVGSDDLHTLKNTSEAPIEFMLVNLLGNERGIQNSKTKEELAVEQTIRDYVMAFYLADPKMLKKVLHPKLRKYGWMQKADGSTWRGPLPMTYENSERIVTQWGANYEMGAQGPITIDIYEVSEKISSAKVSAAWGFDYIHLAREKDGRWLIHNVIWQSWPGGEMR